MLTDNRVLVDNLRPQPALLCVQRKAQKRIITEEDLIEANIDSFGDEIGKTTNRITSMFEVQARYPEDSEEYRILDYRIKCGQLYQQNAIDKAKGIIAKPMPREWHDRFYVAEIEDENTKEYLSSLLAEKKPYFMRYIYPSLMREYNKYIKGLNRKTQREFNATIDNLLNKPKTELSKRELEFLEYYYKKIPVGISNCVMNQICKKFEAAFDGFVRQRSADIAFDYTIMKSGTAYTKLQYRTIQNLFNDYNTRLRNFRIYASREWVNRYESIAHLEEMRDEFRRDCDVACSNAKVLCEILLDVSYKRSGTKQFVWDMCGEEIINNLLQKNNNFICRPVLSAAGDVEFKGRTFSFIENEIGVDS